LISRDGIEYMLTSAVTNFAEFPPLGTVLTIILGIGLAQSVGTLNAGTGRNVIPDRAEMQIETRGATEDLDAAEAEMEDVGRGTSAVCDEEWPGIVEEACGGAKFVLRVLPEASIGGSEDATVIMRRVRERGGMATYMIFGSPLAAGHHNPAFDWEEEAILVGVEALARTIRRLCAA
jgi:aminobenzoyl-glutamate utilization protein A